ncbi:hypothetical protein ACTJKC_03495 [Pedobacter sp. 22226]|uniref:hypothetical protein n=1 Tax=Pedobacter sp. 22226 TaxID=3453894 RepID=UPI003F82587F
MIDEHNFSILTTRKLITNENGEFNLGHTEAATHLSFGHFKDVKSFTSGIIQLKNGIDIKYFIETGKASMIMIQGVKTLIRTQEMTNQNLENVTIIWDKKTKNKFLSLSKPSPHT